MLALVAAVDEAVHRLALAVAAVEQPIARTRTLAVELVAPLPAGSDVSAVTRSRQVALHTVDFGTCARWSTLRFRQNWMGAVDSPLPRRMRSGCAQSTFGFAR